MTRKILPIIAPALLSLALLSLFIGLRSSGKEGQGWSSVIDSDGRGYYVYLPAFLLYHDLTFDTCVSLERQLIGNPDYLPEYLVSLDGHRVNKYFTGVALLQFPFFSVAVLFSEFTGRTVDGYSFWFQFFGGLAAIVYLIAGSWFLMSLLREFTSKQWVVAFTLFAIVAGTNLLYYTVRQPLMSHVYSFFAVNGFLYATTLWFHSNKKRWLFLSGLFLGIVILVRPVDGIVVILVPFLARGWTPLKECIKTFVKPVNIFLFLLPMFMILAVQPVAWYLQAGSFLLWSYGNEGFSWLRPEITNLLFSFRKGLFIYTPITLLALSGLLHLWRAEKFRLFSAVVFLILVVWIMASWWNWYYGDGFGMRPMIGFYGLFAILLAIALDRSKRWGAVLYLTIASLLIILNLVQSWQYSKGIMHAFNMDRIKYAYIFLKTDPSLKDSIGGSNDIPWYETRLGKACFSFSEKNVYIDSLSRYNTGPNLSSSELPFIPGRYFLKGSFYVRDLCRGASNSILFVISIAEVDSVRNYWYGFNINDIPYYDTLSWRAINFSFNTPVITNRDAYIKTYLWNPVKKRLKVAYFSLQFYPVGMNGSRFQEYDSVSRHSLLPADESELLVGLRLD